MKGIVRCSVNYVPLSPICFMERSAKVCRDRASAVYGDVTFTWKEMRERCVRLAIHALGISPSDVVAAFLPNVPAMYELQLGVPMAGALLCLLNILLDSAKVVFMDDQFTGIVSRAIEIISKSEDACIPIPVSVHVETQPFPKVGGLEYESLLLSGKLDIQISWPKDEQESITINYTSVTTSRQKGVVYSHRGAYLNKMAVAMLHELNPLPIYLFIK